MPEAHPAQSSGQAGDPGRLPPPGWYPDPQQPGHQRWWDGEGWTEHVHPPAPAPGQQPAAGPGAGPQWPAPGSQPDPAWLAARAASQSRQWAMFAHLSALIGLFTALPWLGPLIIYLVKKDDDPFAAEQAREALNFNLSVFIYLLVGTVATVVLAIILIGLLLIPVLIGIAIAWLVFVIVAAVRASSGQPYRYPLTIRMVS